MGILAATEVGKFPPKRSSGMERAQGLGLGCGAGGNGVILFSLSFFLSFFSFLSLSHLSSFIGQRRWRVAGGELRHLAGSPGGGGDIRVLSYSN